MKILTLNNLLIVGGIALIIFTVIQCNQRAKFKTEAETEAAELERVQNEYNALVALVDSLTIETVRIIEENPQGVVIAEPEPILQNISQLVKTERELKRLMDINASLLNRANEAEKSYQEALEVLRQEGQVIIETVPVGDALPVVETSREQEGEFYTLKYLIHSRGDLIFTNFDVDVRPNILKVEVPVPGATIDNTKHNFLGASIGAMTFDPVRFDELKIPLSLVYIRRNLGVSGGVIVDREFKVIEGYQLNIKAGIRW